MASVFDALMNPTPIANQPVTPAGLGPGTGGGVKPAVLNIAKRPPLTVARPPVSDNPDNPDQPVASGPPMPLGPAPDTSGVQARPSLLTKLIGQPASNFIGDAAAGMTAVPVGADPISAFAFGLAGARAATAGRLKTTQDQQWAAEDRAYSREQDKAKMGLEERKLAIEEGKANKGLMVDPSTGDLSPSGQATVFKMVQTYRSNLANNLYKQLDSQIYGGGMTGDQIAAAQADIQRQIDAAAVAYGRKMRDAIQRGVDPDVADMQAQQADTAAPPTESPDQAPPTDQGGGLDILGNIKRGADIVLGRGQPDAADAGAIPPPPPSVPPGSQYNPGRKLWRTPDGRIVDLNGNTVSGQ